MVLHQTKTKTTHALQTITLSDHESERVVKFAWNESEGLYINGAKSLLSRQMLQPSWKHKSLEKILEILKGDEDGNGGIHGSISIVRTLLDSFTSIDEKSTF